MSLTFALPLASPGGAAPPAARGGAARPAAPASLRCVRPCRANPAPARPRSMAGALRAPPARCPRLARAAAREPARCRTAPAAPCASASGAVVPAGVESLRHVLPDGTGLEVLKSAAEGGGPKPPLVFVHGSYHGAWCWAPHFLPYFAARGHDTYAVSLRGHGRGSHTDDIADFMRTLGAPPVLMAHSFSGLFVMEYFARGGSLPPLAGGGLLASTPPSGNSAMIGRFLRRDLIKSIKLTYSMVARGFEKSLPLCRESFFSKSMPDAEVELYQSVLKEQSGVRLLDLRSLPDDLPVAPPPAGAPPMLVLGAEDDFLVDREGSEESAAQYGTEAVILPDLAHDVMLDVGWERAAAAIDAFLEGL